MEKVNTGKDFPFRTGLRKRRISMPGKDAEKYSSPRKGKLIDNGEIYDIFIVVIF